MGGHFTRVVPPENRELLMELHDKFLGRKYELHGEWDVVRKDGSPLTILASAAYLVNAEGEPKKATFVLDISERKRAERRLSETVDRLEVSSSVLNCRKAPE